MARRPPRQRVSCTARGLRPQVKSVVPILVIAGAAGVWLALVLLALTYLGVHVPA